MKHLRTLKLANYVLGAFVSLIALFGLLHIVAGIVADPQPTDTGGKAIFILFGLVLFLAGAGLTAAHIYTGLMVTAGRGRAAQTTLATMHIANFPLGTLYAVFAMWVCWMNPETKAIFDRPEGRRVR
jgi:hypothetical protein